MFRSALLTAAAASLALGALSVAPAEAAARLPLAPHMPLTATEWSATGTRSGAAVVSVGRHFAGNQDDCAAGPVMPVGKRLAGNQDCAEAAPMEPAGRRWGDSQDECAAAAAPLQRVWVRRVGMRLPNQDCAQAGPVVPVARGLVL